ncbi:hypothetical protein ACFL43_00455 [Thermodesulfobacteriota bacterium]
MINTAIDNIIDLKEHQDQTSAELKAEKKKEAIEKRRLNNLIQRLDADAWYSHCIANGCIYVYGYHWQVGYYGHKPLSIELIPYNISSGYSPEEAQKVRASYRQAMR